MFLKLTLWGYGLQSPLNVRFLNKIKNQSCCPIRADESRFFSNRIIKCGTSMLGIKPEISRLWSDTAITRINSCVPDFKLFLIRICTARSHLSTPKSQIYQFSAISSSLFLLLMKSVTWFLHDGCCLPLVLLPCGVHRKIFFDTSIFT